MTAPESKNYLVDDGTGEMYPPNLYDYRGFAQGVNSFDDVTDDHIALFHQQGFLVIHEALTGGQVQTILDALNMLKLRHIVIESDGIYKVVPEEYDVLSYYANSIVHWIAEG